MCRADARTSDLRTAVAPGFKVGGYPHWSQEPQVPCCTCGKEMDYLLAIDSSEFDGGTYERGCQTPNNMYGKRPTRRAARCDVPPG